MQAETPKKDNGKTPSEENPINPKEDFPNNKEIQSNFENVQARGKVGRS